MLNAKLLLSEDKYLFTFQDETQLWISKEFIEKYPQLPFQDIIKHSEKYEDGSYYIDIPYSPMKKVILFLTEDNVDIESLNLRDSYDIYEIFIEYSVTVDNDLKSDLLYHIKELFPLFLNKNNYNIYQDVSYMINQENLNIPMELFNSEEKEIRIKGFFTPQRKNEFLYYSLLFKMMNVTKVSIEYDYTSNIPLEYIYPLSIKDIFPSLKELKIVVTTHYKETELLLNPNSDEYIMEYIRLFNKNNYTIENSDEYEYYTESDMNEYNRISSVNNNNLHYSRDSIDSYNGKRRKTELPKLYKYIVNEAIYTNDYSNVEINEIENEYTLKDTVNIEYDHKTNDIIFIIDKVSTEHGISQLLLLPSYMYNYSKYDATIIMKLFEEGTFDFITLLNANMIKDLTNIIDDNLLIKIISTHVFPNVTELIYDDNNGSFQLSSIKKECFPKLHIINYTLEITTKNFESLFPTSLLSMIDTIRIYNIGFRQDEELILLLDNLFNTHSIHVDIADNSIYYFPHLKGLFEKKLLSIHKLIIDSSDSKSIEILDSIENNKQNIDCLYITFKDNEELFNSSNITHKNNNRNSLERFLKSNILEYLNELYVKFDDVKSIEYLKWISNLFNDNKFKTIKILKTNLRSIEDNSSSEYFSMFENIMNNLISKTSYAFIEVIKDIPDENFYALYTADNFPQLKSIKLCVFIIKDCWNISIERIYKYIHKNNFPLSSTIQLRVLNSSYDYIYDPNTSIFRYKYDTHSFIDTIIGSENETMSQYEIETLFDYIYDEEQLSKLINFITTGKFSKLKEFTIYIDCDISTEQIDIYEQQLNDSSFIQENHVNYEFN
ncbi:hypothetical protein WA158_004288 [Blastocystis sp. Blastoise]